MNYLIIVIVISVISFCAGMMIKRRAGFGAMNQKRTAAKERGKRKILAFLKQRRIITNNQVQRMLGVSDATATNYLEELEQANAIVQKGKTGRGSHYILK